MASTLLRELQGGPTCGLPDWVARSTVESEGLPRIRGTTARHEVRRPTKQRSGCRPMHAAGSS